MPVYRRSEQLSANLRQLFDQIAGDDGSAGEEISKSRLIIRLKTRDPEVEIVVNGRKNPVEVSYGTTRLRPDLDIDLSADALHRILLAELSLKQALTSGQLRVRGQVFKSYALEELFRRGQELYPGIWNQQIDQA
jgi:hypothetical protein